MKWEYKIEWVCNIPPHTKDVTNFHSDHLLPPEEREQYGDHTWQKAIALNLNELGKQGWEVVSISQDILNNQACDGFVLLKRPKQED